MFVGQGGGDLAVFRIAHVILDLEVFLGCLFGFGLWRTTYLYIIGHVNRTVWLGPMENHVFIYYRPRINITVWLGLNAMASYSGVSTSTSG